MAKKKFYAVRAGRNTGIFMTWAECEKQVKGFPGAEYKSFLTAEEAEAYMDGESSASTGESVEAINERVQAEISALTDDQVIAFVDGSYSAEIGDKPRYSYGVVLITNDGMDTLSGGGDDENYVDSRNVAGEIQGVESAISWAVDKGKKEIKVFYDYEGIRKWAVKEWKANARISQDYVKFFDEHAKKIKVTFEHVKAHTGIQYNEMVDQLAKDALQF